MTWTLFTDRIAGKEVQILLDRQFEEAAPTELGRLCSVGISCRLPAGAGFWDPDESDELDKIEDTILATAGGLSRSYAVYVARICSRGFRELYFYAGHAAQLELLPSALPELGDRIQFDEKSDPTWTWYVDLMQRLRRSETARN